MTESLQLQEHLTFKERLKRGESVYGFFLIELQSPNWGVLLDDCGADFAIFDMEHGRFNLSDLACMLPSFRTSRSSALIRIPTIRREYFQRSLDFGFSGIVVPMVETADQVKECVELMRYPPRGRRGMGGSNLSNRIINGKSTKSTDENSVLIIQIESALGFKNLDAILDVEGIDLVFIGNYDLSSFMQIPNTIKSGVLRETMETITRKAAEHGLPTGGFMKDPQAIADFRKMGFRLFGLEVDTGVFEAGMKYLVDTVNK